MVTPSGERNCRHMRVKHGTPPKGWRAVRSALMPLENGPNPEAALERLRELAANLTDRQTVLADERARLRAAVVSRTLELL